MRSHRITAAASAGLAPVKTRDEPEQLLNPVDTTRLAQVNQRLQVLVSELEAS